MSALVSGYASSDEEDNRVGSSTTAQAGPSGSHHVDVDEEDDDEAVEAAARKDLFSLQSLESLKKADGGLDGGTSTSVAVTAAPDVLAEVRQWNTTRSW
jgi:pre-mRNA-processing factor 17